MSVSSIYKKNKCKTQEIEGRMKKDGLENPPRPKLHNHVLPMERELSNIYL